MGGSEVKCQSVVPHRRQTHSLSLHEICSNAYLSFNTPTWHCSYNSVNFSPYFTINCGVKSSPTIHRENSPFTQTTAEPTLSSWGDWPREKKFPSPLATRQARSYRANQVTQTLLFSRPFDLAHVCHGNKFCSKPALTWRLTLVLAFPAHCISN